MAPPTVTVTVRYSKPGTQPPVYLAGSFSDPAWQPQEMEHTTNPDGEHEYHKNVQIEKGKEYQYKFRLGPGDWWTLNEDAPTVTDDIGNRNNLLTIPAYKENNSNMGHPSSSPLQEEETSKDNMEEQSTHEIKQTIGSTEKTESTERPEYHTQTIAPTVAIDDTTTEEPLQGSNKEGTNILKSQLLTPEVIQTNHSISPERARTPELADTAAEVADSAAKLDHEEPTPPISDDEAGRIGYRRMSSTPIPQVARVAAEVADVAATLDQESVDQAEMPLPQKVGEEEDEFDSGAETPPEERVPLFPHECPGPNDLVVQSRRESIIPPPSPSKSTQDEEIDLNDPTLTPFPTNREEIYAEIRSMEGRLPVDEVRLDGSPPTSTLANGRHQERTDLLSPSPRMLMEQSPSLGSIDEEQEVEENPLELPKAFMHKLEEQDTESSEEENGVVEPDPTPVSGIANRNGDLKEIDEVPIIVARSLGSEFQASSSIEEPVKTQLSSAENLKPQTAPIVSKQEDTTTTPNKIPDLNTDSAAEDSGVDMEDDSNPRETESMSKGIGASSGNDIREAPAPTPKPTIKIEEVDQNVKPKIQTPAEKTPSIHSLDGGICPEGSHTVPAPTTPFIVSDRQLGHDDDTTRRISSGEQGPSIIVQRATPRSSMEIRASEPDTAGSSGVASGESPSVRARKQQVVSPPPDRSRTPTSIRSNNQNIKNRNFLKAIWRAVFVEWIGGFIKKLCGGGRKT
ncbi:hypothetical protein BGZ60DRAFT_180509 [Tricladium varicosporioides]|nr:hypothetical protein BGZ60DRAFT_180509 [Hymenoscyphus varicosporioides]